LGLELADFAGLNGYTVAKRSIFIIYEQGIVRYVWISEDPSVEPKYDEIEKALEQIV
jgi:glutaredoxin-dependent peroxiredoxin